MIRELKHVKKGIEDGVFKAIRLIRVNSDETREVIIPYSRATHVKECMPRFELISSELKRGLKPGTYIIECRTGNSPSALVKPFKIIIPNALPEGSGKETHQKEEYIHPEVMQDFIDKDDFINLLKENSNLKADKQVLMLKVELLERQLAEKNTGLSDANTPTSVAGIAIKALEDNLPTVLGIFDKFMSQKDRAMDLEERKLDMADSGKVKIKKQKPAFDKNKYYQDVLAKMIELENQDPNSFEATLDDLENKDPELYHFICTQMGLYDQEEEQGEEAA